MGTGPLETIGLKNYKEATGTDAEKIARCKLACYTDSTCTVWQFGSKDGCWVEHQPDFAATSTDKESVWAKEEFVQGQNIEHTCPPYKPGDIAMAMDHRWHRPWSARSCR